MKPIKFIFSSLFSNKTIIDESKKQPWWLAIVLVILSCIIAVVPIFTSVMKSNGSDIIATAQNYSLDYSLQKFSQDYLNGSSCTIKVENGKLTAENFDFAEVKYNDQITLLVKYVPFEADSVIYKDTFVEEAKSILTSLQTSDKYVIPAEGETTSTDIKGHVYSTLLLGSEGVYLYVYNSTATVTYNQEKTIISAPTPVASIYGTYENIKGDLANISNYYVGTSTVEKNENALASWKEFFDVAYASPRNQTAWSTTGMYLAINGVILLVSSLMIFLLSKSKTSIQKYKFLESLKMICFCALCPALLSLLVGLIMPSFISMGFMMFIVLRVTWLSMKATSPDQAAQAVRK